MPVQVEWDDDAHTTLHFKFHRPWTWEQFFEAAARSQSLIKESPHMVYTISDTRHAGALPSGTITQIRRSLQSVAPQTGGTVAIGVTPPIKVIVELFQRMNIPIAKQWMVAASMEEARKIIGGWKSQEASSGLP
jgi:hypothetical protein